MTSPAFPQSTLHKGTGFLFILTIAISYMLSVVIRSNINLNYVTRDLEKPLSGVMLIAFFCVASSYSN
jgi:hypothetical protein